MIRLEMRLLALCVFSVAAATVEAAPALQPGEYIMGRGFGDLQITRDKAGSLKFTIETVGANGHSCSLDGEIVKGQSTIVSDYAEGPCVVTFTPTAIGIDVKAVDSETCRAYCGARAGFEGEYARPAAACRPAAVAASRKAFKQQYDKKQFGDARTTLEPLLDQCEDTLDWLTAGWIRNDLAITLHRLGDDEACRDVLDALSEDAAMTDAEIKEAYPPSDADSYLPIVRATRTNLRLCKGN